MNKEKIKSTWQLEKERRAEVRKACILLACEMAGGLLLVLSIFGFAYLGLFL